MTKIEDEELRGALKQIIDDWLDNDIPVTSLALPDEQEVLLVVDRLMILLRGHK